MLPSRRRFNLIEFAVAIVVLGGVAAVALPRLSRAASEPEDRALVRSLRMLRSGLELYATEHGGNYPPLADVTRALTQYSNPAGTTFSEKRDRSAGVTCGVYLREIPRLPVDLLRRGAAGIAGTDGPGIGWIYTINSAGVGQIRANATASETDSRGVPYDSY